MRLLLFRLPVFCCALLGVALAAFAQTGVLKGKVKLQDSKTHDGVKVSAQRYTGTKPVAEPVAVSTNEKGEFAFTTLATGAYVLSFTKQGYKTYTSRQQEVTSGETLQLKETVPIAKEGESFAEVRGAVLYGAGYSLPNAIVTIERIDGGKKFKQEKVSQEGGEFGFRLKAEKAKYRVTAQARGFETASTEIEIDGDELRHRVDV